jgi:RNA polymerase sigma factor for flagellar operon FliA
MNDVRSIVPDAGEAHLTTSEEMSRYDFIVRRVVARLLKRLPPNVLRADLLSAGRIGLFDALRKGGNTQGLAFEVYARMRIQGAIFDELRAEDWLSRTARRRADEIEGEVEHPTLLGFDDLSEGSLSQLVDTRVDTALAQLEAAEESALLAGAIAGLPARERMVVSLYYMSGVALGDVAVTLRVSIARASQLKARGLGLLRAALSPGARGRNGTAGALERTAA